MTNKRLGRGLAEIIDTTSQEPREFLQLPVEQIRAGRFQPRTTIETQALEELKASIQRSGVIEPVIVRPLAGGAYELVAGERRLRATQALGRQVIPAIIKTLSDQEALELSLIENVQRENLNPLEEAKGYARLRDEFGYTQEEIAAKVGKDRATISNLLRLLALPEEIQEALRGMAITMGHAKALLSVDDPARQRALYLRVKARGLSVRQTEALASAWMPQHRRRRPPADPQTKRIEDELRRALGTKVAVLPRKKGGRIFIEYFSSDDLSRILQLVGASV